ncbi:MAG: T9SS type A sorting domain-containing protein [Saprospirales bacterium]|nr:T9SS type A sorting domain-containing protein [Saprospirales bacterium]
MEIQLFDTQGQELKRWRKSGNTLQLDIPPHIPPGMYFLKLYSPMTNYAPLQIVIF